MGVHKYFKDSVNADVGYRRIWHIAFPIIIGSLVQNLLNITDTIFLGRLGVVALGAGAIGGLLHLAAVMVAYGFTIGTQIVVARRFGQKKYGSIGITLTHSFYFLLTLSLLLFWVLWQMAPVILSATLKSPRVMVAAVEFISWRKWGLFFVVISLLFQSFFIGIGRTKIISVANIVVVITNIILDYCMIFGNFGFPAMGIAGAALASVIAELLGAVFYVVYTMVAIDSVKYNLFAFTRFSSNFLRPLLRVSLPTMLQNLLSFSCWLLFFLFIENMGERVLAASNIVRSLYVLLLIPVWGFASATSSLTSYLIGSGRKEEVIGLVMRSEMLSLASVLVVLVVSAFFSHDLLMLFTTDMALVKFTSPILLVVAVAGPMLSIGMIAFQAVAGTGKTNITLLFETSDLVIYLIFAFLFSMVLHFSISAVWTVEILYGTFLAVSSLLYLKYGKWRNASI
ncbi:MAG TPA: MATE family efflux transporter [Williamwhitmania sp.]|nr:MATE family efflux transporter [Williamwhitmania sp.]